jgi:hypothetical protein
MINLYAKVLAESELSYQILAPSSDAVVRNILCVAVALLECTTTPPPPLWSLLPLPHLILMERRSGKAKG